MPPMLFPNSTPPRVNDPAAVNRLDRKILELGIKRDAMPAACRGPLEEEIAVLSRRRALLRVGGGK
jgi:hypothetical protein